MSRYKIKEDPNEIINSLVNEALNNENLRKKGLFYDYIPDDVHDKGLKLENYVIPPITEILDTYNWGLYLDCKEIGVINVWIVAEYENYQNNMERFFF